MSKLPLILLIGSTAVGKTELAIQLAEKLNGGIVSTDSRPSNKFTVIPPRYN